VVVGRDGDEHALLLGVGVDAVEPHAAPVVDGAGALVGRHAVWEARRAAIGLQDTEVGDDVVGHRRDGEPAGDAHRLGERGDERDVARVLVVGDQLQQVVGDGELVALAHDGHLCVAFFGGVAEHRQDHELARGQTPGVGREARDDLGVVLAGRPLDVLVVGVGVGHRRVVVARPFVLQQLDVLEVQRHALPQEDLDAQARGELEREPDRAADHGREQRRANAREQHAHEGLLLQRLDRQQARQRVAEAEDVHRLQRRQRVDHQPGQALFQDDAQREHQHQRPRALKIALADPRDRQECAGREHQHDGLDGGGEDAQRRQAGQIGAECGRNTIIDAR